MQLTIRHETTYRYTAPAYYSIQQLRLTPRNEPHQRVLDWGISAPGRLVPFVDAFGNTTHTMVVKGAHDLIHVVVTGTLEVAALSGGRTGTGHPNGSGSGSPLSPLVFTVETPLTAAVEPVREFAGRHLKGIDRSSGFLSLAESICSAVEYESGATEVGSTAADALRIGRGVCQDHAHLFIACCRAQGVPARYVSGYFHSGDPAQAKTEAASHAWADVWLESEGWVSIDVTHRKFSSERHCRLAIGRDYLSAAPIRGVRTGGGKESLKVDVAVRSPDA